MLTCIKLNRKIIEQNRREQVKTAEPVSVLSYAYKFYIWDSVNVLDRLCPAVLFVYWFKKKSLASRVQFSKTEKVFLYISTAIYKYSKLYLLKISEVLLQM